MARTKKRTIPKRFDDLPMCMLVKDVSAVMGISAPKAYELVHSEGFPSIQVGRKIVIPRDRFLKWFYQEDYETITGDKPENTTLKLMN